MYPQKYSIIFCSVVLISSCIQSKEDNQAVKEATLLVSNFTPDRFARLKHWNYTQGKSRNFWYFDSLPYMESSLTVFQSRNDSDIITVERPQEFNNTYSINPEVVDIFQKEVFNQDLNRLTITRQKDTVSFRAEDTSGRQKLLTIIELREHVVYNQADPLDIYNNLTLLKDTLHFKGLVNDKYLGNFTQFILPSGYILTYLPDNLYLNPTFAEDWRKAFDRGKNMSKNWNLRAPKKD